MSYDNTKSTTISGFNFKLSVEATTPRMAELMQSMLLNECSLCKDFDCCLVMLPKPMPAEDIKSTLLSLRGITDVHFYYTAKKVVLTAIIQNNEKLKEIITKAVSSYTAEPEVFFGEDAFFNPVIKNILIPEKECFTRHWIAARHSGEVLTYNKFIGKTP